MKEDFLSLICMCPNSDLLEYNTQIIKHITHTAKTAANAPTNPKIVISENATITIMHLGSLRLLGVSFK